MNKSAFLQLIQQVSNISDQQTEELEKVAATFPYCQTAHLLLAKSAYDKGSMLSTQRLRRASSYATDRQLLKRVIYTSYAPEPVFAIEETAATAVLVEEVVAVEEPEAVVYTSYEEIAVSEEPEVILTEETEALHETEAEVYTLSIPDVEDTDPVLFNAEEAENSIDSELAMLLTFNRLSSSSTDLLAARPVAVPPLLPVSTEPEQTFADHFSETGELLAELEESEKEEITLSLDVALDQAADLYFENDIVVQIAKPASEIPFTPATEVSDIIEADHESAEIIYSPDEIDRLYSEDSLGYWMGSSRLGEVLQLKDENTTPRPFDFHPELILEYSKTHELEKAIQPSAHALSHQLDIIDQFLKLNPRLKTMANVKMKPEPQEDLSLKSSKIKKGMASESLANIFLKQGKVNKAIKIYEQLILKSPEKKAYFAEQIEKLQNIN
ncbi:hypothetical protein [Pontibacter vulgaris]|uniref:hypothetical protein n=1 Tax=Pontibacter vulgaris TaxID=2905679 RepID=UPI001FA6FAEA|nr:hypothetical protein [Pontibacter vulgaris]